MAENLDLLGDPIPENFGGRGRPAHIPTVRNRNKIIVLLAMGWGEDKVAQAIGITRPTLRKHYFRELKVRAEARARLEGELLVTQAAKALSGDTQAYREVRRALEKNDVEKVAYQAPASAQRDKRGKKELRQDAAEVAGVGRFAPGAPPLRLTSH